MLYSEQVSASIQSSAEPSWLEPDNTELSFVEQATWLFPSTSDAPVGLSWPLQYKPGRLRHLTSEQVDELWMSDELWYGLWVLSWDFNVVSAEYEASNHSVDVRTPTRF